MRKKKGRKERRKRCQNLTFSAINLFLNHASAYSKVFLQVFCEMQGSIILSVWHCFVSGFVHVASLVVIMLIHQYGQFGISLDLTK